MNNRAAEWLKQADFDLETAAAMVQTKRNFYAVFFCHLAVEKGLKALYQELLTQLPPKTHNLVYLLSKIELHPQPDLERFIIRLNTASIATRYPEDLEQLKAAYNQELTQEIIDRSKEVLSWIKQQLS